jgi:nicotinamide-nucleotide amidase
MAFFLQRNMKRPEQKLLDFFRTHNMTFALAESVTCGFAASKIGSVKGASEIFAGGIVCYDESVKIKLLKVPSRLIKKHTAESQQVTDALAVGLSKRIHADVHAALTGLAAPGGTETKQKPVGTVFMSVYFKGKLYRLRKKFNGSPMQIKKKACYQLFNLALMAAKNKLRPAAFSHHFFNL